MPSRRLGAVIAAAALLVSCGGEETAEPLPEPEPIAPQCAVADQVLEDGTCLPPGVDQCAAGFLADDLGGCVAVLPAEPCPFGLMAVPGDEVCREVAPCGAAPWGDIPVEANTQYVDGTFAGTSTGSADQPWTTLAEAIDAAAPGAIVALASGVYAADLDLMKPVRLWGRCPSEVSLDATGQLVFGTGSTGSEVHGLAVTGDRLIASDVELLLDQLWLHDSAWQALHASDLLGPTQLTLRNSLIEQSTMMAMTAPGSAVTIEDCEIRATRPMTTGEHGGGVQAGFGEADGGRATLTIRGSHLSQHIVGGVLLFGVDATIEATAIRDITGSVTHPRGCAVVLQALDGQRPVLWLNGSTASRNRGAGILSMGGDATIERTTVRWTDGQLSDGMFGRGVLSQYDPDSAAPSTLIMRRSLVDANRDGGISVIGATAVVEGVIVRDTQPQAADDEDGRGLSVQIEPDLGLGASLDLSYSLFEGNRNTGLFVGAAVVTIHHVIVRDTLPQVSDGMNGAGLMLQNEPASGARATVAIASSWIADNTNVGIFAGGVDLTLLDTHITGTLPQQADGLMGDGVSAVAGVAPTIIDIQQSDISDNSRAGVANFGSSVTISSTLLECNAFALNGQDDGGPFVFTDAGGNSCGCDGAAGVCKVQTTEMVPPTPLPPQD